MDPARIIGRDPQRRILVTALSDAASGRARTVVMRGEAGSGKTVLLEEAVTVASDRFHALRLSGHPAERNLPYSAIHRLLHALGRADAVAPASTDPLHDAAALLGVLAQVAELRPLLLVIDDAQWLDRASLRALIFVSRRLEADAVCLLFGVRAAHRALVDVGEQVELEPLSPTDAAALVRAAFPDATALTSARIAEHAAGLPLALCEIPAELTAAQRRGAAALPESLPLGPSLTGVFRRRLESLGDGERLALLAASFDPLDAARYRDALNALGGDLDDLDAAERTGLARVVDGRCVFRHPSVPAAMRQDARRRELIAVHRALADVLAADPIRYAEHLSRQPDVPRAARFAAMRDAAGAAQRAHAHADAARFWVDAAESAPAEQEHACRSEAAAAFLRAGAAPHAETLLQQSLTEAIDDAERAGLWRDLVLVSLWSRSGPPQDADDILRRGVEFLRAPDAATRAAGIDLVGTLATTALAAGRYRQAHETCRMLRAHTGATLTTAQRLLCDVTGVMVAADGAGGELRGDWAADYPWHRVLDPDATTGYVTAVLGWLDEDRILRVAIERSREVFDAQGPSVPGAYVIGSMTASLERNLGRWDRAEREFEALERLVLDSDFTAPFPFIALRHAHLLAARGDGDGCARLQRAAREVAPVWTETMAHLDHCVAGLLALAERDFPRASEQLGRAAAIERDSGQAPSGYLSRFADEFEAAWHQGTEHDLGDALTDFEDAMRRVGHRTMLGLAARCRALIAPDADVDERFAETLALLEGEKAGFEKARTMLLWGRRLRRMRRKTDAVEQLILAEALFIQLGATRWRDICRSELAACGIRRVQDAPEGVAAGLTPREFEVAREVAAGASNAEAARRLFISPRTVEFHLSQAFHKLDVRGRSELADVFPAAAHGSS